MSETFPSVITNKTERENNIETARKRGNTQKHVAFVDKRVCWVFGIYACVRKCVTLLSEIWISERIFYCIAHEL